MQMLSVLKMGASLSSSVFGKVYYGLLVLAVIFFASPEGAGAREMHLSSILKCDIIDLVTREGIHDFYIFFLYVRKCAF